MLRFIETIKIENYKACNLFYHNKRLNNTRNYFFQLSDLIDISQHIDYKLFTSPAKWKCRIIYAENIISIELSEYFPKKVRNLQLVDYNDIDYQYKYENREIFQKLLKENSEFDDILIIKNHLITDTSFSNVVFFDGNHYFTPNTYLLNGTKRQQLIDSKLIVETKISKNDINKYEKIILINAMLDIEDKVEIQIFSEG